MKEEHYTNGDVTLIIRKIADNRWIGFNPKTWQTIRKRSPFRVMMQADLHVMDRFKHQAGIHTTADSQYWANGKTKWTKARLDSDAKLALKFNISKDWSTE